MHRPAGHPFPAPALDITIRRAPERATVFLTGEVDMVTASQVTDALSRLLDQGCRTVEVDLSGVGFMAAAGLAVLVEADRRYHGRKAQLLLVRPTPACSRLFMLTGLDERLTIS